MFEEIRYLLSGYPDIEVTGTYSRPSAALEELEKKRPDAVFLDIDMPEMNGLELARKLREKKPTVGIVFMTAYSEYALEAYGTYPQDYLLKPIEEARFGNTLTHLKKWVSLQKPGRDAGYRIKCFGKFAFDAGSDPQRPDTAAFGSRKEQMLCAYLINRFGQPVSREELLEGLFGGDEDAKSVNYLHVMIYNIRQRIDSLNVDCQLCYAGGRYVFKAAPGVCDYVDFVTFVYANLTVNAGNEAEAGRIASLFSDDYLKSEDFPWIAETQGWLENEYSRLMLQLSGYYAAKKDLGNAESCLKTLVQKIPLHESGWQALLRFYLDNGSRLAFLKGYEQYAKVLKGELSLAPEPFLTENYRKIRRQLYYT